MELALHLWIKHHVIVTMATIAANVMASVYKYMYLYSYGAAINTSYKHYHVADKT